LNKEIQI